MDPSTLIETGNCDGEKGLVTEATDWEPNPHEALDSLSTAAEGETESLDRENVLELEAFTERKQWIQEQIKVSGR
jgi:hypothetical protein